MNRKFLKDLFERTASTYVQSFLGLLLASGATNWDTITTAMYAAIPAALAIVKGALARFYGDRDTAALTK